MSARRTPRRLRGRRRGVTGVLADVLLDVAAVLGALSLLAVAACLVLGLRPAVVVSGSMAPGIPVGSLAFARTVPADQVAVGDVVTVPRTTGQGLVTHRVVAAERDGGSTSLRLQGDANAEPDALPYLVQEVGLVVGSVPVAGTVVAAVQEHVVVVVAVLVLLLVVLVLVPGRRAARHREGVARGTPA